MRILIMGFAKLKYMPYINFYLDNMDLKKNEVHILYWNRDLQQEKTMDYSDCILHEFRCYQEDDVSKFLKIKSFIKYRKYAKQLIQKEKFDFLIALHSMPAILMSNILIEQYREKYIFDYRDSTYERFAPYKKLIGKIVCNSKYTFVSSDSFRRFLPSECSNKIYTSHNLLTESLLHRDEKRLDEKKTDKIRISFWGFIRHEELNKEIIKKISRDARFELHYYGREQQVAVNLKKYAKEIDAGNVFFHGEYKPEDRYEFVKNTDLIHNIYYDANTMLAVGNKYYDGLIFYIPQLCMQGSFMGQNSEKAAVGFACDPYDSLFTDRIYDYYFKIDRIDFNKNCDNELFRILKQVEKGNALLKKCFAVESEK